MTELNGNDLPALPTPEEVRARLEVLRSRIAAVGGDVDAVTVLAVTKGQPAAVVNLALAAGMSELGENYAQELVAKVAWADVHLGVPSAARWHFIGHLQRNKVRQLATHVWLWQSIDRASLLAEVARRAPGARVLIQVNATHEAQKAGCAPKETTALVQAAERMGLEVLGLMTVGPSDETLDPRPGFELVRTMVDRLKLSICSMGMTGDLEAAIQCGSTMVRVGTALFGPRSATAAVGD